MAKNIGLKYKKMNIVATKMYKRANQLVFYTIQFKCISSIYQNIIICMNPNQEHKRRKEDPKAQESASASEEEEEEDGDQYQSDFIVDDEEESEQYGRSYKKKYSDDEQSQKKKKHKKKDKKHKKEKKRRQKQQSYDEDDLDVIDNEELQFKRLKKKKQTRREYDEDEDPDQEDVVYDDVIQGEESLSGDDVGYPIQDQSNSFEEIQEVIRREQEIFDPADLKKLIIEEQDKELVQIDLPQRYISQLKIYSKSSKKTIEQLRQAIETQDKHHQAQWIYNKIRSLGLLQSYEQRESKQRIKRVLECMHKDHLEIMYIFYYRKKIYHDYLNLQVLWKIQEFDEEWQTIREKQKKIIDFLEIFLPSYMQVPKELSELAYLCPDQRTLKYFEDYSQFAEARWSNKSSNAASIQSEKKAAQKIAKFAFITQIAEKGVAHQLEESNIFLSPQNLCYNLKARNQEKKPRTPHVQPKDEFQMLIRRAGDGIEDKVKYPLLTFDHRFKTITKYLCYELYSYPELRRILKQKYYKRLIMSTQPTKKGEQDIDLYSIYFPVKRIKEKPISTLKRQIWILAQNAKKLGLISIEVRFEWQLANSDKNDKEKERDVVYMEIAKNYFQISNGKALDIWNLFRKRILQGMLNDHFLPQFHAQVREDLSREGEREIIHACCQKLRQQLNKGPSLKEGKPKRILSMVLEDTKLGIAFVDESGKPQFTFHIIITNDEQLRRFVGDQNLSSYIKEYKPDMILIAANCKRAQTLRKELRDPKLFPQSIFCAFGQYEVPRLVAKKQIINGIAEQEAVLQAISMARLKSNPMAEIISLWSEQTAQNGILAMNLHQYQNFVNQRKLKNSLQKVIIEVVNMVGLDINEVNKNQHLQKQLQFISGLGPKKSFVLLQKLKEGHLEILSRKRIQELLSKEVAKNCCAFLKIETSYHRLLFEKVEKEKKNQPPTKQYEEINLLDMTRIPQEWYSLVIGKIRQSNGNKTPITLTELRSKKQFARLADENIFLIEIFKNPEKIRGIEWRFKENGLFDQELVKSEFMSRFRSTREPQRVMQNRQIFFNLLKETPDTLKRYMIMQVRVLSMKKNYLNVIIPENGLFGYIKLQGKSPQQLEKYQKIYEKGTTIKAVIIGFPFDQKTFRDQPSQEQELLKIQMALDFPHKDNDRHDGSRHDCMATCFPAVVKEIHPLIDLEKERFDLRKEDRPIIQVKEEKYIPKNIKADFRRISHPKFKNISAVPAIDMMKDSPIGDFVIRPSSQGPDYLTITWNFFKGVIVHIKVRCEQKGMNSMNITYRVEDKENRNFSSLQEIIEKCIKPMNIFVQDITSNKKFLNLPLQQIENQVKRQTQNDSSHIYYYFGVSEDYPQYVLLFYMYKDKKPIRELIKIKSTGLSFHDQQFSNTRELIAWFKEHLKEKEYQKYVKNATQLMQRMK